MKFPFIGRNRKGSYKKLGNRYLFARLPRNFLLKEDLPPAVQRVSDAIVRVQARYTQNNTGAGTGLNLNGVVLTALHVVRRGAEDIHVVHEEQRTKAREISRDVDQDLVLLKVESSLPASRIVFSAENGLGDGELYAFGYLFSILGRNDRSITYKEHVCAYRIDDRVSRRVCRVLGDNFFEVAIPAWAVDFFAGFSGGVLVDGDGAVRGMMRGGRKAGKIPLLFPASIRGLNSSTLKDFLEQNNNGQV